MNVSYVKTLLAAAAATVALLGPVKAMAAVDMFLKADGIQGEATAKGHENEIVVLSWSWGATGPTATKKSTACVNDIHFVKYIDKASGPLIVNTITGAVIPTAKLTISRSTADGVVDFLTITMTNVTITSYQTGGSTGDNSLAESVALHFDSMDGKYTPTNSDESPGTAVPWSISNTGC